MNKAKNTASRVRALLIPGALLFAGVLVSLGSSQGEAPAKAKVNHYIGAAKCKNCHNSPETGDQYGTWMSKSHAKAYERLASPEAKETGKAHGVEDPQKADACLECHVTAFGQPAEAIKKGFDVALGVQCETCHGPGEDHMKARMAAAAKGEKGDVVLPAGEVVNVPPAETCKGCHNAKSPSYKPFCYYRFLEKIDHRNPKKHTPEELAKVLVCGCAEEHECGEQCKGSCPIPMSERKK